MYLGSLDVDGGLRQRFQLGTLTGSPEFSFPIFLEHSFRAEDAMTEYKIPQLETYVAPEGRDQILWLEPGGIRHLFKTASITDKTPDKQKEPWVALKAGAGNYDFVSDDGWTYHYESGSIRSLAAPTGRKLEFETEGLRVRRIYQVAGGKETNLLASQDDAQSLLVKLTIGPDLHVFNYTPKTQQLADWHSPQMGTHSITFSYSGKGLIETVKLPQAQKLTYIWGNRSGDWQTDAGFELPTQGNGAFLIADSEYKFNYGLTKAGINLLRTDAAGIKEGFAFNPRTQQLVRKQRDGGESTEFFGTKGESKNQLESARDARGRETVRMIYDEQGRVKTKQTLGQAPLRFEYDEQDRITKVFRLDDLIKCYEYPRSVGVPPLGVPNTPTASEQASSPPPNRLKAELQRQHQPVKITNALGDSIEIEYTAAGQVKRYTNLDGAVYEFSYDDLGQLKEEHLPMGYKKTIERDTFGRVTKVTALNGQATQYDYTKENRLASVNENGTAWEYQYDAEGSLTSLLRDGATWQTTEREKIADTGEEIVRQKNSQGDETVFQFNKDGHLVKAIDALKQKTTYKHDALGQIAGWEDARGAKADLERDAEGRVAGVDTGEGGKLQMAYDLTGRIRKKSNGTQDISYHYDKEGRLDKIDYGQGQTIDYTFDKYGRIETALTGQGVKTTYEWDALDRKTSERNDIPKVGFTLVKWTYTAGNRPKTVSVYKNGDDLKARLQETGYAYDLLGRYQTISIDGVEKIWYDYDQKSMELQQKRFWNGWLVKYKFWPDGHPKSLVTTDGDGKKIKDVSYVWGADGKLQQRVLDGILHEYTYDPLGRLTDVVKTEVKKL